MNWTDEALMAYADGEGDAAQRAELTQALAADAALRARVEALQAQRSRVSAAFAAVLDEPLPDRLRQRLVAAPDAAGAGSATVVSFAGQRAARTRARSIPGWAQWGGMAASLLLGALLGVQFAERAGDTAFGVREGRLVATGPIERALSTQLASAGPPGTVAVQLSFVDRAGAYCRTFSTDAVAGLACRQGRDWAVRTLTAAEGTPAGTMRQAASALPAAVLEAVDQHIAGDPLDAERERQARDRGWVPES